MAFSAFERTVALRYLRPHRQEGFVSVIALFSLLGIMLGVATLIIVMSVMNGFRQELLDRILGLNGHMDVNAVDGGPIPDFDPVVEAIRRVPGVVTAAPVVEGQVMATANGVAGGALVRGLRRADLEARPIIAGGLVMGSFDDFGGNDAVLVGDKLARRLGLLVGGRVTLISPNGNPTVFGTVPRSKAYRVVGIFNVGMYEYDSTFIFMPLAAAQVYFRVPDAVTNLEIMIENPDQVAAARAPIFAAAGRPVRLRDWRQANATFFGALQTERNVMFLILTLIIVVAAFNIISGMIMLVKDKGRDIAILRTMGATRGMIMRIFFLSGASVGFLGTVAGLGLGLVFCANIEAIRQLLQSLTGTELFSPEIYFLAHMPAEVEPMEVGVVTLMAFGLSFLATLYPSWRAARLDPVEALRYE